MGPTPRVLLLDHSVYRDVYRPLEHWRATFPTGVPIVAVGADDAPPPLDGFTHLLISGSESSIVAPEPWVEPRIALVREAIDRGLAVLGSCHGHQLLALALGGRVGVAAEPELGWIELDVDAGAAPFDGARLPPTVFASHFDEVTEAPPGCDVVARTERCAIHAFCHRERPLWGIQAHPEIDPDTGEFLLREFARVEPRVAALHIDRPPRDSGWGIALAEAFLRAGGAG